MTGRLIRTALRSALNGVRYVAPVRPRAATGSTAAVYRQLEHDFGMLAPPIALHSPAPAVLAAAWTMLRESLVVTTSVSRVTKEAVAAAVSLGNACPYCVEVHSAALGGLHVGPESGALAAGELAGIADPGIRAVATWARESGTRLGAAGRRRPFPAAHAPQLLGVAVAFQYLNRMVHVFLGESPLPPQVPAGARGPADRFLGRFLRGPALRGARPGESVALLAPAPLAEDLAWAAGDRHVAEAFGRAAAAVDGAARRSVPVTVRELVAAELSDWDGEPAGLSRAWVEAPALGLPAADRAAGRLALLVAKAAYQVDGETVEAYRRTQPADDALIELVSWAALAAARHAGGWLAGQEPDQVTHAA
ncbi:MAG: carboxymuconolactone decarboxylase family protein [Actinophytocola sp.]|uniref:carboxymuconolactone decarboxylase family protein n=1 Tax=Actinophytocola sp. TaxID=1872138 RepID=UPI0013215839|nr:carboxymuconolactone decarboxylase family protein [Actinophytocola sp.]MPZ81266.1 carboxymuconolactone decarboxylase family protein [Actinophytocola sp.]